MKAGTVMSLNFSPFSRLLEVSMLAFVIGVAGACGGGNSMSAKPVGIFIHPRSATAYSNSAEDHVAYTVVVGYIGGKDVPLTSGVQWERLTGAWVSFDLASATATCREPAPPDTFLYPQAATISATATVEGQTFSDITTLYCL